MGELIKLCTRKLWTIICHYHLWNAMICKNAKSFYHRPHFVEVVGLLPDTVAGSRPQQCNNRC